MRMVVRSGLDSLKVKTLYGDGNRWEIEDFVLSCEGAYENFLACSETLLRFGIDGVGKSTDGWCEQLAYLRSPGK